MGKRINISDLAEDDFYDEQAPSPTPAEPGHAPVADRMGHPMVPIGTVVTNPLNKRPPGEDDEIEGMAETIRSHGKVIQPLVVCSAQAFFAEFPHLAKQIGDAEWVVLVGNRRLLASRRAGVDDVPIIVNDDKVASMFEVMLIENAHHRAMPPLLEAEAMVEVQKKDDISNRELARRIGKSHVYVAQRLALLKLIAPLKAAFERGELKIELARQIGDLSEAEQRRIVEAGKPYRLRGGNGVTAQAVRARTIRVSTPAIAAASIRERFNASELQELVRLLTETLDAASDSGRQPAQR